MSKDVFSHDEFFKRIFSNTEGVKAFLKGNLPDYIKDELDLSRLEQVSESFVSADLRERISDIVFKIPLRDGSGSVYICFLIEHKSHPDKYVLVQIGGYTFTGYQKQIDNKEPLSLIIPILFYHGREKWEYQVMENLFPNIKEEWKQFVPTINYIYNNINELSDAQIESLNNRLLVASLLTLKHIWNKDWIEKNMVRLLIMTNADTDRIQRSLIFYIFKRYKFEKDFLNSLPEPTKTNVMNTYDVIFEDGVRIGIERGIEKGIEKGRSEGIEEGIEKGLEQGLEKGKKEVALKLIEMGGYTVSQISSITGISESEVSVLWKSHNKKEGNKGK